MDATMARRAHWCDCVVQKWTDAVDSCVEVYLRSVIAPFLRWHEVFYSKLNAALRHMADRSDVPTWFTANFVTYARTALVVPCLGCMVLHRHLLASLLVLLVDFGDFLDGVLARYWKHLHQQQQQPTGSSNDAAFDVTIVRGTPQVIPTWVIQNRSQAYGGFIDAVCDKAFVVPCWICLLSTTRPDDSVLSTMLQFVTLWVLILAETASACIRFRAYFTSGGISAPQVVGLDFSCSAVKADHVGKAKQTFEMVGTALFILPTVRFLGLILLVAAIPLAYESIRRKVKKRVIYVDGSNSVQFIHHDIICFWSRAKGMGSKLIVGIHASDDDNNNSSENVGVNVKDILNACAIDVVDMVMVEAPLKPSLPFLNYHGIDYVVCLKRDSNNAIEQDVIDANRCLVLGDDDDDDDIVRPLRGGGEKSSKND